MELLEVDTTLDHQSSSKEADTLLDINSIVHKNIEQHIPSLDGYVAPLKLETGRYRVNRVPVEERTCEACNGNNNNNNIYLKSNIQNSSIDYKYK